MIFKMFISSFIYKSLKIVINISIIIKYKLYINIISCDIINIIYYNTCNTIPSDK